MRYLLSPSLTVNGLLLPLRSYTGAPKKLSTVSDIAFFLFLSRFFIQNLDYFFREFITHGLKVDDIIGFIEQGGLTREQTQAKVSDLLFSTAGNDHGDPVTGDLSI